MFAQKLLETNKRADNGHFTETSPNFTLADHSYGKESVKVLHVTRNGPTHSIKEFEVSSHLKLYSKNEYTTGDNLDVVSTDSQKNTVYILAKKYGVKSAEEFALLAANHFLTTYRHIEEVHIHVDQAPWERITHEHQNSAQLSTTNIYPHLQKHNHAFIFTPTAYRYCDILQKRNERPTVISGLKGLRLLKSTQSSFSNFVNDDYRTLKDTNDRIFSTVVDAQWQFSSIDRIDFCHAWNSVKDCLVRSFSGDLATGVHSPGVQYTLYQALTEVLKSVPAILSISARMPNKHYNLFDASEFQTLIPGDNKEVFVAFDKPYGIIYARLDRKDIASKL